MAVKSRRATPKDFETLHSLHRELIEYEAKLDLLLKKGKEYYKYDKKHCKELLKKKDQIILIAEENNMPIGYIYGEIQKVPNWLTPKKRGFIWDAFVKRDARKTGVCTKLTNEMLKIFRSKGVSWIRLDVYSKNFNSIKVWKKLGFKDYIIEMSKTI